MLDIFRIKKLSHLSFVDKSALSIYPWKDCKPGKTSSVTLPLFESNIAIVSSAGMYVRELHDTFDHTIKGGDCSYRVIQRNIEIDQLIDGHRSRSFDHSGIKKNPSTGMPIPQLKSLVEEGFIGSLNHRHFSLMGSILAPLRLIKYTIPEIVEKLVRDKVNAVLLVPV
ncbi:MAG TPA: glycine/sarcosine/betaine reductase selenoprotein B family protein [Candidatus Marinimicrobia bacterium]|jgi:D-proline reductase (dithiol) PrdB|nr:glycine/sarcosine/betaine reductase selenoprotein B family protein [Candidatus Neomarinimicrobiota bacterium]MDP6260531.1 glycine/sarcosine/betaine reductase selenoprotein B family protein [Candidatus Neomarinimicrobiota bacterium]MDP7128500.1 glycine/sarcosine/betaine reductase selenoprotein B family protein [Candidatus Neomarinimicrobiota bacterium]MEE1506791.1 glycine/sarcosine/betaine reductase selenoprotein B family protein [Candidatus Neomarinimicrobiota bacterium]MEE1573377.1 glycine/|tara:strand:+ start:260 stop:763 length:504 start_codon:yes stop_codon:yes gene_type:complete